MSTNDTPESGTLPGRFEFVREGDPMTVPSNPSWNRFSDVIRSFSAEAGATYSAQDAVGTPDAQDHFRGTEEPSCDIGYDLQNALVDGSGNPDDASGDGIIRDSENQLDDTHLIVERQTGASDLGNDNAGVRFYTVVRGAFVESVNPTLDPSAEAPILMELSYQPRKVRSYRIDQPSASTTVDVVSTSANDTMDVTIENEDAGTTDTVTLNGTTAVTSLESFADIDAVWMASAPEGDITVSDGSGTTLMTIDGGNTYSGDGQAVDGDRGIPPLGTGSHASAIGTTYEHFVGDQFERPSGSSVRARVNSASWSLENDIETNPVHSSRAPVVDVGNRTITVDADVGGPYVSHDGMMEALTKNQSDLVHGLDNCTVTFKNTVPQGTGRERGNSEGVASYGETFEASGEPAISVSNP